MDLILKAAQFATRAHHGQVRKYTKRPFIEHPARVAGKMACHPIADEELVAASFSHDILDYTKVPLWEIERDIGPGVASLVRWVSKHSKGSTAPRGVRKKMERDVLRDAPRPAKIIKMLDRIDNLLEMDRAPEDFRELYFQESLLLVKAIGDADEDLAQDLTLLAQCS